LRIWNYYNFVILVLEKEIPTPLWGFLKMGEESGKIILKELIYLYVFLAFLLAAAFIGYMLFNNKNMRSYNHYMKRKKKLEESISSIDASQLYSNQNVALGINGKDKKLAISTMKNGIPVPIVFGYEDIVACEIVEYGADKSVAAAKGKRVTAGLGDSVGQVFGQKEAERISRIDLKISLANSEPSYVLANFLFWEVSKDSEEYEVASEAVAKWHGIIEKIISKQKANLDR
jgi:hypothetical protein